MRRRTLIPSGKNVLKIRQDCFDLTEIPHWQADCAPSVGISMLGELVDLGVKYGFLEKSGFWYFAGEIRIRQGRDAAKQYLKDNPEIAGKLEADIRCSISMALQDTAASPAEELIPAAEEELAG